MGSRASGDVTERFFLVGNQNPIINVISIRYYASIYIGLNIFILKYLTTNNFIHTGTDSVISVEKSTGNVIRRKMNFPTVNVVCFLRYFFTE